MYKIVSLSLITLFLSLALVSTTYAQQDPYTDYLKNLNEYFTARRTFDASRARYNSFKTLQSKETAVQDARKMLQTGRSALTQYTFYTAQVLERSEAINKRVKDEILADLQTHNGYLQSVENVLSENPTVSDINTQSQALTTRYGYIKTTATQAITYIEAVNVYDDIRKMKDVVDSLDNINRTLPDGTQQKTVAQYWIDTARSDTLKDEEDTLAFIENIYPQPTVSAGGKTQRSFEGTGSIQSTTTSIGQIKARLTTRGTKAKETFSIMVEGYRSL